MKVEVRRIFWLACVLLAALAPAQAFAQAAAPGTPSAEEVLARVRAAVGYERLRAHRNGVSAEGTAHVSGLDSRFTLLFTPDGRFRSDIEGPLGGVKGFDGAVCWEVDSSGMPHVLELEDLEIAQYNAWIRSGRWLAEDGPFAASLDPSKTDDKQVALRLKLKKGLLEATALVDRATWLPKTFSRTGPGKEVVELGDYREVLGFRFPHRITRRVGGVTSVYEVRSVAPATAAASARFGRVTRRPADTRWDASAPARVEARRARSGHLLVHPLVNGKDVGWFILDSGAGGMVIDAKTADRLGMPAFGEVVAVGVGGEMKTHYRRGETFRLGPLTVNGTQYMALDLGFMAGSFGVAVAGVCGREFFDRAVVEIDLPAESVAVYDPARYRLAGAAWQELFFSGRIPAVRARFEGDREGFFKLDTGSNLTVSLHGPAVERYQLLAGRETRATQSGGVGGSQASWMGKLAWFEFAGRRLEDLEVEFSGATVGVFSDVYATGNIGVGLLREFRLVFDYGNKRVAFAPHQAAEPAGAGAP